jgi:hypothetical protein
MTIKIFDETRFYRETDEYKSYLKDLVGRKYRSEIDDEVEMSRYIFTALSSKEKAEIVKIKIESMDIDAWLDFLAEIDFYASDFAENFKDTTLKIATNESRTKLVDNMIRFFDIDMWRDLIIDSESKDKEFYELTKETLFPILEPHLLAWLDNKDFDTSKAAEDIKRFAKWLMVDVEDDFRAAYEIFV